MCGVLGLSIFSAKQLHVRKDVKSLTAEEKSAFVNAVLKLKATPDPDYPAQSWYDSFVEWHRDAFQCDLSWNQGDNWAGAAHNSPTFLPWHREYLARFEQALRTVSGDDSMTLPYWDWTDPESTAAVVSSDFMGGNGDPDQGWAVVDGPFRKGNWTITVTDPAELYDPATTDLQPSYIRRNFGAALQGESSLPTAAGVQSSLQVEHYDHAPYDASAPLDESFRNYLEGWRDATPATCDGNWIDVSQQPDSPHELHNVVHLYVGGVWKVDGKVAQGTMTYNTSPNDPVFFLHHANIDRIFSEWENGSGRGYLPESGAQVGWNATDTMWPWYDRTINSWFGTERNGYTYAAP